MINASAISGQYQSGVVVADVSEIKAARKPCRKPERERISPRFFGNRCPKVAIDRTTDIRLTIRRSKKPVGAFYDVFDLADGWKALVLGMYRGRACARRSIPRWRSISFEPTHTNPEPKSVLKRSKPWRVHAR